MRGPVCRVPVLRACAAAMLLALPLAAQGSDDAPEPRVVAVGALRLRIPGRWQERTPTVRMRYTQFSLRKTHAKLETVRLLVEIPGERRFLRRRRAEFVVFHFGRRGAGRLRSVVKDWVEQFALKRPGVEEDRRAAIFEGKHHGGSYTLVDVSGTYYYNVGPSFRFEAEFVHGARMLAAVVNTKEGPYYVKLTGPAELVGSAAHAFRAAFGGSERSEVPLDDELRRMAGRVRVRFGICGRPYDATGVRVILGPAEATCAAEGTVFEQARPGQQRLRVERIEGYRPVPPREIEVEAGRTVEVVVALEPYDC